MFCTAALAVFGGLLAVKLIRRRRWAHLRGEGGGCGHWRARHMRGWTRGRFYREGAFVEGPENVQVDPTARIKETFAQLELNDRQREEVNGVFEMIADALGPRFAGWAQIDDALGAIASPEFDRVRATTSLPLAPDAAARLADELDHVHTILTTDQLAKMRELLAKR